LLKNLRGCQDIFLTASFSFMTHLQLSPLSHAEFCSVCLAKFHEQRYSLTGTLFQNESYTLLLTRFTFKVSKGFPS